MKFKYSVILAMLLLAVLAVGSVSATEDIAIDDISDVDLEIDDTSDIDIDDVSDIPDENLRTTYTELNITTGSNFTDINAKIADGIYSGYQFNFENDTYENFSMVTGDNNKFVGNGATLVGSTDNLFTITNSSGIIITGFNMNINNSTKAAIYGSGVKDVEITNNVIYGGKDGINIFQTYENVSIIGNTISGVTRDAISLVNHKNFTDAEWNAWSSSIVSNNNITGGQYAMFFGGNFKGTISGNTITNSTYGMQFAGKKNETNGKLYANIYGNTMSGVQTGIDMNHPSVVYLNMYFNNIVTVNPTVNYAISCNSYFTNATHGSIYVNLNNLNGLVKQSFINKVTEFYFNTNYTIVP